MSERGQAGFTARAAAIGIAIVAVILIIGTWWMGQNAKRATEDAVSSISMFYLDELTGRRVLLAEDVDINAQIQFQLLRLLRMLSMRMYKRACRLA